MTISLDGSLLYDDGEPGEIGYGFEPVIDCLFSQADAKRSDRVYFLLPEEDTARIVNRRREDSCVDSAAKEPSPTLSSAVVLDAPVAIAIAMSRDVHMNLLAVVESCNRANENNQGATTHGSLDIQKLITMLVEDAAMMNSRPGSWEGANLKQVLACHGY